MIFLSEHGLTVPVVMVVMRQLNSLKDLLPHLGWFIWSKELVKTGEMSP